MMTLRSSAVIGLLLSLTLPVTFCVAISGSLPYFGYWFAFVPTAGALPSISASRHLAPFHQPERVIEFATGQQSGIGGDTRTAQLQLEAVVETEPKSVGMGFTR
jgi:hypothetical protein